MKVFLETLVSYKYLDTDIGEFKVYSNNVVEMWDRNGMGDWGILSTTDHQYDALLAAGYIQKV